MAVAHADGGAEQRDVPIDRGPHRVRPLLQRRVEPSASENRNVTVPLGRAATAAPACHSGAPRTGGLPPELAALM